MEKITKLMAAGLCGLALSACGGGGSDNNIVPKGAVAACFTMPETMRFRVNYFQANGIVVPGAYYDRTAGPATFNGQSVTQSETVGHVIYPGFPEYFRDVEYWTVTDAGMTFLGHAIEQLVMTPENPNEYVWMTFLDYTANPAPVIPLDIQPGQSVDFASALVVAENFDAPASFTFVGQETLTLAGKAFSDVCHFRLQGTPPGLTSPVTTDLWYAPGYGEIQRRDTSTDDSVWRYDGDLS